MFVNGKRLPERAPFQASVVQSSNGVGCKLVDVHLLSRSTAMRRKLMLAMTEARMTRGIVPSRIPKEMPIYYPDSVFIHALQGRHHLTWCTVCDPTSDRAVPIVYAHLSTPGIIEPITITRCDPVPVLMPALAPLKFPDQFEAADEQIMRIRSEFKQPTTEY